ncbi:MAG: type IV secretion system DNA-binding domain-containing protein [bacterium]|nr:MAG: type IV secretion system DNA-binding domain-containing protein [bacterium]
MSRLVTISVKLPRLQEVTPEAAKTFLSTLTSISSVSSFQKLFGTKPQVLSLELVTVNQQILFLITVDEELERFVQTQLQSNYPLVIMQKINDPLQSQSLFVKNFKLKNGSYYPIATYDKFADIDPMASVLSVLSKAESNEVSMVQIALEATSSSWQSKGSNYADFGTKKEDGTYTPRTDKSVIVEKVSYPGFKASIRVASTSNKTLNELSSSLGVFTRSDGNTFTSKKVSLWGKASVVDDLLDRKVIGNDILNILEIATLWHLPSDKIKTATIAWGTSVLSEPPENLPNAITATEEEKQHINFFGKTIFKNRDTIFGVKDIDRRRHIWAIGKTGTGKSTMLENMAIDDMKKDRGICYIDPHGDACEILLDYIPKRRINDVIYFNPADTEYPITINPLEVRNKEEAELVVSGLMAIFTKVWANVWSARMEYILRNAFLTLAEVPGSTLADVLSLISNQGYRARVVEKLQDKALVNFWRDEFDKMPPNLQKEAIAPIQNKVGQFVTSPMIRRVIGSPKSTIALDDAMNEGKIILANLSQGRLGEDNSALLGAMLITKLQLVAMRRVKIEEEQRRDFFMYVDEFQNFATTSFIKILSEARKYRLSVMLANQYMAQIPEDVQKAILGNAGTVTCFALGASDADILHKEFAEVFSQNDLVNLSKYQIAIKMMIDGQTSRPFVANTLPLPISKNQNRQKVIDVSRSRWATKV